MIDWVSISAFLPALFRWRLASISSLGPALVRASAALKLPISEIFNPLIGVQIVGLVFIFTMAYLLGRREEKRLGLTGSQTDAVPSQRALSDEETKLRRPRNFWVNLILTFAVLGTMVAMGEKIPPAIMFMLGTCVALMINYPNVDMQRKRVDAHAKAALMMASILLAAGVFTGIMQGSGMLKAMAQTAVTFVPRKWLSIYPLCLVLYQCLLVFFSTLTPSISVFFPLSPRSASSSACPRFSSLKPPYLGR